MPKFFVANEQINNDTIIILGEDVNHIKNVLRLKKDDEIIICNKDNSNNYKAKIYDEEKDSIICKIIEQLQIKSEANVHLHILQGLPKAEKLELVIEKCVELGVNEITPVEMKRCVVKLDDKSKAKKIERWQKISEIAAKQSGRDIIPKINNVILLKNVYQLLENYDIVLVAYENEKNTTLKQVINSFKAEHKIKNENQLKIALLIGPEGGIDSNEIDFMKENKAKIVTLGNRILRTETVALSVASIIMYEFDN